MAESYTYKVTENEFTPTFNLPQNVTMYWHVRPMGVVPSIYSTVFQFHTADSSGSAVDGQAQKQIPGGFIDPNPQLGRCQIML